MCAAKAVDSSALKWTYSALTATPIPRTLGMALEGLRDLSVIAHRYQRRLAIKPLCAVKQRGR